jgi:hypothetical protein
MTMSGKDPMMIITDDLYHKVISDLTFVSGKIAQEESQQRFKEILNKLEPLIPDIRTRTANVAPKKGRPQGKQITIAQKIENDS